MTGHAIPKEIPSLDPHVDDVDAMTPHEATPPAATAGVAISPGVRATLSATVVATAGTGIPIILSMPTGVLTIASAGVLSVIGALGIWETGAQIVDGVRRMANGPAPAGAHARLAATIRGAIDAIVREDEDVALHRQLARDAMRGAALKSLDAYVDRRPRLTRPDRKLLVGQVERALARLDAVPRDGEVDVVLMERVLHQLVDPMLAIIDPPVPPSVATPPMPARSIPPADIAPKEANASYQEWQAGQMRESKAVKTEAPVPVEPPRPTPMEVLARDMHEVERGADTLAEIARLRAIIQEVGVECLDRERRREISSLLDVHLPAMAKSYAKAARIAEGLDLGRLRRRTLEGLLPILAALREAHAECLRHAEDEVNARARFIETRHPRPPEELDPLG
jgi:hypothetical protein